MRGDVFQLPNNVILFIRCYFYLVMVSIFRLQLLQHLVGILHCSRGNLLLHCLYVIFPNSCQPSDHFLDLFLFLLPLFIFYEIWLFRDVYRVDIIHIIVGYSGVSFLDDHFLLNFCTSSLEIRIFYTREESIADFDESCLWCLHLQALFRRLARLDDIRGDKATTQPHLITASPMHKLLIKLQRPNL